MTQKQLVEMLAKQVRCRVLRCGGWSNFARYCRSANRYDCDPSYRNNYLGFRAALIRRQRDPKATS